jgi:hypothetical protein
VNILSGIFTILFAVWVAIMALVLLAILVKVFLRWVFDVKGAREDQKHALKILKDIRASVGTDSFDIEEPTSSGEQRAEIRSQHQ